MIGLVGAIDLAVDTFSSILPVWTVYLGFTLLIIGGIGVNIISIINRKEKKKLDIKKKSTERELPPVHDSLCSCQDCIDKRFRKFNH